MKITKLLKIIVSNIFKINKRVLSDTGGTISARYCYSVWMRHIISVLENGLYFPKSCVEFGPGDSIGTGIAALLSGVDKYYALDVVKYADQERNLKIFNELIDLFMKKSDIPDEHEFPRVMPYLKSYKFPAEFFSDDYLKKVLDEARLKEIESAILGKGVRPGQKIEISYIAPWNDIKDIPENSIDMIFSQAVLEHVDQIDELYEVMFHLLKPGGYMSHLIDFKSHNTAKEWNGHWTYSDFQWRLIRGSLPYLLNRLPHSAHISLLKDTGFKIVSDVKIKMDSEISRKQLARRFMNLSDDDLTTSAAFIIAQKEG